MLQSTKDALEQVEKSLKDGSSVTDACKAAKLSLSRYYYYRTQNATAKPAKKKMTKKNNLKVIDLPQTIHTHASQMFLVVGSPSELALFAKGIK